MTTDKLIKLFDVFHYKYDLNSVFEDFLTISSYALRNRFYGQGYEDREKEYTKIMNKYTYDERIRLVEIFSQIALSLDGSPRDVLGELYMGMALGNSHRGQFFTPYSVSKCMAELAYDEDTIADTINEKGYIYVNEPTCGSGGMCIAFADTMKMHNRDISKELVFVAQDIDLRCVKMAYIQLSLLGIPANVIHGNSLTMEVKDMWYTLQYVIKFSENKTENKIEDNIELEAAFSE